MKRFKMLLGVGIIVLCSMFTAFIPSVVLGAVPKLINFQGILRDGSGNPVANGSYSTTFTIYDAAAGGTNLWTETQSVNTVNGLFTILLGASNPVPDSVFNDSSRYLGVAVSSDPEMTPRQKLVSVPFSSGNWSTSGNGGTEPGRNFLGTTDNQALELKVNGLRALRLDPTGFTPNVIGGHSTNSITAGVFAATIGGGGFSGFANRITDNYGAIGGGARNRAGDDAGTTNDKNGATVGGGSDNIASGNEATVAGGNGNTASGGQAAVGGGLLNVASGIRAIVGGGHGNTANAEAATVGGGNSNTASGGFSTVPGGRANMASGEYSFATGQSNSASGFWSSVGGGVLNISDDTATTVAGGRNNRARGRYATVGGGGGGNPADSNSALGDWSTVSGGIRNIANGINATVGGGVFNTASNNRAVVGGGGENTASGDYSTVSGGFQNTASGLSAAISGGGANRASGIYDAIGGGAFDTTDGGYATVPGGYGNKASGDRSFAAGYRAKAIHAGSFVWGDRTEADFASTGLDQFLIRASGGVGIGTNAPYANLTMNGSIGYKSSTSPMLYMYESGTQNQTKRVIAHSPGFPSFGLLYNDSVDAMYFLGPSVGIGTNAPTTNLEVAGEISAISGSAAAPSFTFSGDLNTGIFRPAADVVAFSTGGTERMRVTSTGNVGIGTTAPVYDLNVVGTGSGAHVGINKTVNDGNLINFLQDGTIEGFIGVVGTTVSYNAFTGSHYGWTEEAIERGELVSFTGVNQNSHDNPKAEIIYGIRRSSIPNDPACLGSYLALSEPNQPNSSENPHLIMAVGNGDMWVVDEGQNIQPGDYLISSSTPGHAMRDDEVKYPIGHIVARAGEGVDWGSESGMTGGRKHKKISVLFGNFVRSNPSTVATTLEGLQEIIQKQQLEIENLKKTVLKVSSSEMAEKEQ